MKSKSWLQLSASLAAVVLGALAISSSASAAVVTFDTIGGANGDAFTSITENGVTVASTSGNWQKGFSVGNPTPSVFTFSTTASLTVTTGGTFQFLSFDLGTGGLSVPSYTYQGFFNNVQILSGSGSPGGNAFVAVNSSNTSLLLDRLVITTTLTSTSANIDNISVNLGSTVPDAGSTAALLLVGLGALAAVRRRLR